MYKHTVWKFGKIETPEYVQPTTGNRFLKIIEADYDPDNKEHGPIYSITLQDLQGGAIIKNRYFQLAKNKNTGNTFVSKYFKETMTLLAQAIAGPAFLEEQGDEALLNPKDIVGGVVIGTVESNDFTKRDGTTGVAYRVNKYYPAPKDWVEEFSDLVDRDLGIIIQYYEGCEDSDIVVEEDSETEEQEETTPAETEEVEDDE